MGTTAINDQEHYASIAEATLAIAALTAADLVRIGRIAQLRAYRLPGVEWEDLVNEAIERVLSGKRRWPMDLPLIIFLREVIRSLTSEEWRRNAQSNLVAPRANDDGTDPIVMVADPSPDAERAIIARDLLDQIMGLFEGDEAVLGILSGMASGQSAEEIRSHLKLTPRDYETSRRRLRRGLARRFPEGFAG